MKKNIKSLLVILTVAVVVAVVLMGSTAFTKNSINVLGVAVKGNNASAEVNSKAAEMNDYENAVAAMINNIRAKNNINAIAANGSLNEVAAIRSQDLVNRNYFSHYTPEGTNVFDVMRASGVKFRYAGENLAQATPASIGTPEGFLNAWINSPTHMANILRAEYTKIGVSMVESGSRRVVTTVFTN